MFLEDFPSKATGSNVNIQQPTLNIQFPREEELTPVVLPGRFDTTEQDGDPFASLLYFFICSLDIECWFLDIRIPHCVVPPIPLPSPMSLANLKENIPFASFLSIDVHKSCRYTSCSHTMMKTKIAFILDRFGFMGSLTNAADAAFNPYPNSGFQQLFIFCPCRATDSD